MDKSTVLVWLVPLLPFAGFLFQVFVGRGCRKGVVSLVSCGAVLASAVIAWMLAADLWGIAEPERRRIVADLGPWIFVPGLEDGALSVLVRHRLVVDPLTAVMILVVSNIGFLIHLYSTGYMAEERRYARYFAFLNLFTGFMLILVMASNLLLMFVGWEGVGLCSYLLIGFWFEKKENAAAGMKAFIVNRVGDFGFTVGVLTLFVALGNTGVWTLEFADLREHAGALSTGTATLVGILLFVGATGKSAQIPLYVWLPDAMAGPTPVSALIHAATMVTAGVYMVARMGFLYAMAPAALAVVASVGALTALFAGTIGIAQNDIKKVLAYSTVSQLGFMFLGVGVGAFAAGIFHLFTHAFFKACLFLGSGSVIHGMGGEQDIRKMGGLKKKMPWTFWTFLLASLAIAGVPPLAGFFSKDEILWRAFSSGVLPGWLAVCCWGMGAVAAACTAFYMTRLVVKTFLAPPAWAHGGPGAGHGHGQDHGHGHGHGEPHECPWSMRIALVALAAGSVFVGFLGVPHVLHVLHVPTDLFGRWLEPVVQAPVEAHDWRHGPGLEYSLMGASVLIALGGIGAALVLYGKKGGAPARAFAERHPGLYRLVLDKYRVDEAYDRAVVQPLLALNEQAGRFDNGVIDGAVNGTAQAGAALSNGTGAFDNEVVDGAVNASGRATQALGRQVRRIQTGNIRQYLTAAVVGGLSLMALFCLYLTRHEISRFFGG
jgi:NADH-quinone oxidoreductase subunit L